MPSLAAPDKTGDVKITWDPNNPEDVKNARDHFEELKKSGHFFYKITGTGKKGSKMDHFDETEGEVICEFDPKADIIAHKALSGG